MDERPLTPTMINLNIGIEVQLKYTLFSTDHYPNFSFPLKLSHLKVLIEKKKKINYITVSAYSLLSTCFSCHWNFNLLSHMISMLPNPLGTLFDFPQNVSLLTTPLFSLGFSNITASWFSSYLSGCSTSFSLTTSFFFACPLNVRHPTLPSLALLSCPPQNQTHLSLSLQLSSACWWCPKATYLGQTSN